VLPSLWEERNRIHQEEAAWLVMFQFGTLGANNQLMIVCHQKALQFFLGLNTRRSQRMTSSLRPTIGTTLSPRDIKWQNVLPSMWMASEIMHKAGLFNGGLWWNLI